MKRMFTKILGMCAGLFLCAGVQAMDAYTPDLIWAGAKDSLFNETSLNWITDRQSDGACLQHWKKITGLQRQGHQTPAPHE
jgi:hypothetical protein